MGLWFSVFPIVETLVAKGVAALLVGGSYFAARIPRRLIAEVTPQRVIGYPSPTSLNP